MRFQIDWASLIVGSKFTVFALFYFVFEGNFPSTSPRGACIWRDDLTEGFLRYRFRGFHIWRGSYMEGLIFGILRYFHRCQKARDDMPYSHQSLNTFNSCLVQRGLKLLF